MSVASSPAAELVAVEHVGKTVVDATGQFDILTDIDFSLAQGQTLAIAGASGSGKSTLLSIIAGLDVPTRGTVRLAGQDLFALNEDDRAAWRASKLGFVFQSFQLLNHLSALENVMLPLELAGRRDARARATDMLDRVGLAQRAGAFRACSRVASSSAWRWRVPSWCSRRCCWRTSPPAVWTSPPAKA